MWCHLEHFRVFLPGWLALKQGSGTNCRHSLVLCAACLFASHRPIHFMSQGNWAAICNDRGKHRWFSIVNLNIYQDSIKTAIPNQCCICVMHTSFNTVSIRWTAGSVYGLLLLCCFLACAPWLQGLSKRSGRHFQQDGCTLYITYILVCVCGFVLVI